MVLLELTRMLQYTQLTHLVNMKRGGTVARQCGIQVMHLLFILVIIRLEDMKCNIQTTIGIYVIMVYLRTSQQHHPACQGMHREQGVPLAVNRIV